MPTFTNVKLLCHFEGTNGATATSDSSAAAHALTLSSGIALTTAGRLYGEASADFTLAGTSGYIEAADHADWDFGSGTFTVEGAIDFTSAPGGGDIVALVSKWSGYAGSWFLGVVFGEVSFYYSTDGVTAQSIHGGTFTPTLGHYYRLAADRDAGGTIRLYLDGAVLASVYDPSAFYVSTFPLVIGNDAAHGYQPHGRIDAVRIVKGEAAYGGAYTPLGGPFPGAAPLPGHTALLTLDYAHTRGPFVPVAGKASVTAAGLNLAGPQGPFFFTLPATVLVGAATGQAAASGTGASAQSHALTAAASSQGATTPTGAVSQTHALAPDATSQGATSTSGAETSEHTLAAETGSQGASAATGAIEQAHRLDAQSSGQDAATPAGTVSQAHTLAGTASEQSNAAATAIATIQANARPPLRRLNYGAYVPAPKAAREPAPTESPARPIPLAGTPSRQGNASGCGAIRIDHRLRPAPARQGNRSSTGPVRLTIHLRAAPSTQRQASTAGAVRWEFSMVEIATVLELLAA